MAVSADRSISVPEASAAADSGTAERLGLHPGPTAGVFLPAGALLQAPRRTMEKRLRKPLRTRFSEAPEDPWGHRLVPGPVLTVYAVDNRAHGNHECCRYDADEYLCGTTSP